LNDYFTGRDAIEYAFYRIPKALITEPVYRSVSTDAKLLYGLLLDRLDLSVMKGWLDELGRVFLFYKIEAIQADLCCCKEKACKLLCELERAGLIERKRQGQGNPSIIYVKRFVKKSEKPTFGGRKNRP
jgi:hypothetical protein